MQSRNYSATAAESAGAATLSAGTESATTTSSTATSSTTAAVSAAAAALSEEPQEKSDALNTTASNKTILSFKNSAKVRQFIDLANFF